MREEILRAESLSLTYGKGEAAVQAVKNCSLSLKEGQFSLIYGKSGCGKSTLLRILAGLEPPREGKVWVGDTDLYAAGDGQQAALRSRTFGFVFQSFHLIGELTVYENILLPRILTGVPTERRQVEELAAALGVEDQLMKRPPQLSGGQQQRVALARALVNDAKILMADEPTGNLDEASRDAVMALFLRICREQGKTVLMVSHDGSLRPLAHRVYEMQDGEIHG